MSKECEIAGRGEQTCVSGDATHYTRVFILNLALDDSFPKRSVIGGRGYRGVQIRRWIECRAIHSQRTEDFALAEAVELLIGEAFKRNAQEDEADVAVFRVFAGVVSERRGESSRQKFIASFRAKKELLVGRQSGRMRQQHSEGDLVPARIFSGELPHNRDHGYLEIEK